MSEQRHIYSPIESKLEQFVISRVCQPILDRMPRSISPNTITYVNHAICWAAFGFAAWAPFADDRLAFFSRIAAGLLIFTSMILDCLDGMQARRTGRSSSLGEVLDHWFDGLNTPLNAAATLLTLSVDPWSAAVAIGFIGGCYVAQLVVFHVTGRFVQCPTAGVQAQVILSFSFFGFAIFFALTNPEEHQLHREIVANIFVYGCVIAAIQQLIFFYRTAPSAFVHNLKYGALVVGSVLLMGLDLVSPMAGILVFSFVIFRIAGNYVLRTLLNQSYSGFDWWSALWITVLAVSGVFLEGIQVGGYELTMLLPYIAAAWLGALNVLELARNMDALRSMDEASPQLEQNA